MRSYTPSASILCYSAVCWFLVLPTETVLSLFLSHTAYRIQTLVDATTAVQSTVSTIILQLDGRGRTDRVQKRSLACGTRRLSMCL